MPAGPIQSGHENTRKSWGKWLLCPGQTSKSPFIKFQDIWGGLHEVLKEYIKSSCIPKYSARRLIFPAPPKMLVQSNYSLLPSLKVGTMEVWDRSDGDSGIQTCRIWVDRNSWPVWYQLGDLVDKNRSQPKPCKRIGVCQKKTFVLIHSAGNLPGFHRDTRNDTCQELMIFVCNESCFSLSHGRWYEVFQVARDSQTNLHVHTPAVWLAVPST